MNLTFYHGEHSVIFGDKHSWKDWHLIPSAPPVIPPPKVRESYLDIPGTNGSLDISEIVTGFPTYDKRTGSFSFIFLPEFGSSRKMYDMILNTVHGRRIKVILTDDPEYYYEGRVSVKEWGISSQYSGFSFDYTFDPFKLQTHVSPGYSNLVIDGEREININIGSSQMRVTPMVHSDSNMTAVLQRPGEDPVSLQFYQGTYRYPGFTIGPGGATLTVTGSGVVSFDIRGGSL